MTFIYELDLDMVEKYLHVKNEVNRSIGSKVIIRKDRQTDRQTDRHTDRQTDRHTDRQTDTCETFTSLANAVGKDNV